MQTDKNFHNLDSAAALAALESSLSGLTSEEAARRLEQYGPNELREEKGSQSGILSRSNSKVR